MDEDIDIIALWDKGKAISRAPDIDVDKVVRSRSKGTLFWIGVILRIEFWINVIALLLFFYYLIMENKDYVWGSLAVTITVIYLFYYHFLIRQINRFGFDQDVRTSLRKLYRYLRFFLLHYKVVIWCSLVIGFARAFVKDVPQQVPTEQLENPTFWTVMIAFSVVFGGIIGGLMTFLIHLIYGKKIKRLKKLVQDFTQLAS